MVKVKMPDVTLVAPVKLSPVKVTPLTVVFATVEPPKFSAPTNVPAVLTSELPEMFVAAPQVTTAACDAMAVKPRIDAARMPQRMERVTVKCAFIRMIL